MSRGSFEGLYTFREVGEIYDIEEHDNYSIKDVRVNKLKLDELKNLGRLGLLLNRLWLNILDVKNLNVLS